MNAPVSTGHQEADKSVRLADEGTPPDKTGVKRWRDLIFALSLANFCFIQSWHGLFFQNSFGYYNRIPVNRISLMALLINIFAVAAVLWLVGRVCRRLNWRALWFAASVAVCVLTLVPLNFARTHFWNFTGARASGLLTEPWVIAVAVVLALGVLWFHRLAAKFVIIAYVVLSPMLLLTVGKCAWWIIRPPPAAAETVAPMTAPGRTQPRVVWILLDELDQRIGFEARPAGVQMPELSRLYSECFHATNAFPPAGSTMYSLPALTIGREVRSATPISASELALGPNLPAWSATEHVFARARALGFTTALAGWFHPYGRVLGRHLDRCVWASYPPFEEERGFNLGEAILNQLSAVLSQFQQRRLQIRTFKSLQSASLNFLTNSPAGLTFLHLPVPHHPGIYDPKRDRLTLWNYSRHAGYLDNLTLADRLFGNLRRALEQSGTWEQTWIIVSSDHWWRDARQIDHRVPLIIKGPGKNEPMLYSKPLTTTISYHLVLAALKGELTQPSELPQWFDAHRLDPPARYGPNGQPF